MKRVGLIYREGLAKRIKSNVEEKSSTFVLTYSKLSSSQISDLRKELDQAGASMYVSKNRVAAFALKEMEQAELAATLSGQTAFVWSDSDSSAIAKILIKYSEDFENITVPAGLLDGQFLGQNDVKRLSALPSREVLLAQLLSMIQAPVTRFMGALNAKSRDLLSILKQLSEKKGGS